MGNERDKTPQHGDKRTVAAMEAVNTLAKPITDDEAKRKIYEVAEQCRVSCAEVAGIIASLAGEGHSLGSAVSMAKSEATDSGPSEELEQAVTDAEEKLAEDKGLAGCVIVDETCVPAEAVAWTTEPPTEDGLYWVVRTILREDIREYWDRRGELKEALRDVRDSPVVEQAEVERGRYARIGNGPDWRIDSEYVKGWLWHKSGRIVAPEPPSCDPVELSKTLRAGVSVKQACDNLIEANKLSMFKPPQNPNWREPPTTSPPPPPPPPPRRVNHETPNLSAIHGRC